MPGDHDNGRMLGAHGRETDSPQTDATGHSELLELVPAIVYIAEAGQTGRWHYVSPQIEQILGYAPAAWCADAQLWRDRLHEDDREWVLAREARMATAEPNGMAIEYRMRHCDGRVVWIRDDAVMTRGHDGVLRWHGVLSDISERKQVEAELERRAAQQAAVALLGEHALEGAGTVELMQEAVSSGAELLGVEISAVWEVLPAESALVLRAGIGWPESAFGSLRYPAGEGSQAGYTLLTGAPVVVEDWDAENRFEQPDFGGRRTGAGLAVKIEGRSRDPFGVLVIQSMAPRSFVPGDVDFLQALANVLADALERQAIEDAIRERAVHDPLTGLPNRVLFVDRLEHALARLGRQRSPVRDPVPRPRPLQAGQRQPRPPRGRRAPDRCRPTAQAGAARQRHGRPVRRRRVRDPARGHRLRARRDRDRRADRGDLRPAVRPVRHRSTSSLPASASRWPAGASRPTS